MKLHYLVPAIAFAASAPAAFATTPAAHTKTAPAAIAAAATGNAAFAAPRTAAFYGCTSLNDFTYPKHLETDYNSWFEW